MSLDKNKAVVTGFIQAYNNRDLDLFDEFVSLDYVDHTNQIRGRESLKQLITMGFTAFPDWNETVEDIIAEGDKVWVRLAYSGTHKGEWRGIAPSGNKVMMTSVDMYRIVDGKLAEYWNVTNSLNFFKQLGAIEFTKEGKKLFPG